MPKRIGEVLRHIRQNRGLTLEDAAKLAGIRKDVLFRYEAGIIASPNAATLAKLAAAYNTTVEQIFALAEDEPPLYLKKVLTSPTASVFWEQDRPLTFEERKVIATLIEFWLHLTKNGLDALLPADERQVLEQYRAHRDRFLDMPDPQILAAATALASLLKHPEQHNQPPSPTRPRTRTGPKKRQAKTSRVR